MNIIFISFLESVAVTVLIFLFCIEPKVVAWERRLWARFKRFLRRQLRKSKMIVAWAEKPSSKPEYQFHLEDAEVWSRWFTA